MMFKSVDGGTTGLAEASNLLYCDDLVKDVETANNPDRLEVTKYCPRCKKATLHREKKK